MGSLAMVCLYSFLAGFAIVVGGLAGAYFDKCCRRRIEDYVIHWTVAFGGGTLVAAVAFVLTPRGVELFSVPVFSVIFLAGALVFFVLDRAIERRGGLLAQAMAMMMDFIPEAIALGAVFAHDHRLGALLAFFIGVQNLPEAFNAYFDLRRSGHPARWIIGVFCPLSLLGILAAVAGRFFLNNQPHWTAGMMLFSAGGILYLIFQDIAPLSKANNRWEPALGASLGFLLGMIGTKLLG